MATATRKLAFTHAAFADDSSSESGRYQAICLLSGSVEALKVLRDQLDKHLGDTSHVEWKELKGHYPKTKAALAFVETALAHAAASQVRLDVLNWDMHDTRHAVLGRDDIANLARHYWRLFVGVGRRWGNVTWGLFPDEGSKLDWQELKRVIGQTRIVKPDASELLMQFAIHRSQFAITDLRQMTSHKCSLTQLADLLAGMACFSREFAGEAHRWVVAEREKSSGQMLLIAPPSNESEHTKAKRTKFTVIKHLKEHADAQCLGINLSKRGYLWTPKPSNPVSFWPYEPQHPADKAPVRTKG